MERSDPDAFVELAADADRAARGDPAQDNDGDLGGATTDLDHRAVTEQPTDGSAPTAAGMGSSTMRAGRHGGSTEQMLGRLARGTLLHALTRMGRGSGAAAF
jgi:hypothetical protein